MTITTAYFNLNLIDFVNKFKRIRRITLVTKSKEIAARYRNECPQVTRTGTVTIIKN